MKIKYAPTLLNKQPGFYKDDSNILQIILVDNQAQMLSSDLKYNLKMIDGYSSKVLFTLEGQPLDTLANISQRKIQFDLSENELNQLTENEYYRVQVAYKYGDDIGPYSNVAILKCINLPEEVKLEEIEPFKVKLNYSQSANTEKLASVQFGLYSDSWCSKELEKSNKITVTPNLNEITYQFSYYTNLMGIDPDPYDLQLFAKVNYETVDGYQGVAICSISLKNKETIINDARFSSYINTHNDDGIISFCIHSQNDKLKKAKIYRNEEDISFNAIAGWQFFAEINNIPGEYYYDKNIVSGKAYNYLISFEDKDIIFTNQVNYFEDMYLFDQDVLFKIKYNPKVTSFKQVVQEQKIETIGSKYPFICRNGNLNYHEFSIGGLLSYIPTVENLEKYDRVDLKTLPIEGNALKEAFDDLVDITISKENDNDIGVTYSIEFSQPERGKHSIVESGYSIVKTIDEEGYKQQMLDEKGKYFYTTNLTDENIAKELAFKKEILKWLNNGSPKVFKSPKEGTYIVRLTNISLSPEDKLGRMLHNFTCTATEIADCNIDNLKKYQLI